MSVHSMTGFARAEVEAQGRGWAWEVRSVNSKGLEVRCRLPAGLDRLEGAVRAQVAARMKRGNVSVGLSVARGAVTTRYRINEELLGSLIAACRRFPADAGFQAPSPDGLLAVRGVVEPVEEAEDEDARAALDAALLAGLEASLTALVAARSEEGARLEDVLAGQLRAIAGLCDRAETLAAGQVEGLKARLTAQLAELLAQVPPLPEDRLAQEVALLAGKADVREELDRLRAHLASAGEMLAQAGGAVGRRLDFLCQEFNREANTLCSKSADVALTRVGLDLKAVIEQFREQVQNIE